MSDRRGYRGHWNYLAWADYERDLAGDEEAGRYFDRQREEAETRAVAERVDDDREAAE